MKTSDERGGRGRRKGGVKIEEDEPALMGRANYANGVLVAAKAGSSPDPKPAAANDGTIISVSHHSVIRNASRSLEASQPRSRAEVGRAADTTSRPKTFSSTCPSASGPFDPPRTSIIGYWTW
jgi:hypothetical protein